MLIKRDESNRNAILRMRRIEFLIIYAWVAETKVCAACGKRKRTYQAKHDDYGNDPQCYNCLKELIAGNRATDLPAAPVCPPPPNK
jgi:hypothetical protein